MTIDEAIKNLNSLYDCMKVDTDPSFLAAILLGIEALEWIKWRRENYRHPPILPLPGETEK